MTKSPAAPTRQASSSVIPLLVLGIVGVVREFAECNHIGTLGGDLREQRLHDLRGQIRHHRPDARRHQVEQPDLAVKAATRGRNGTAPLRTLMQNGPLQPVGAASLSGPSSIFSGSLLSIRTPR